MTGSSLNVGIIGAGIGGLTAGIAIARAGAHVTILEAASELGEIGAGIQVLTTSHIHCTNADSGSCTPMSRDF